MRSGRVVQAWYTQGRVGRVYTRQGTTPGYREEHLLSGKIAEGGV